MKLEMSVFLEEVVQVCIYYFVCVYVCTHMCMCVCACVCVCMRACAHAQYACPAAAVIVTRNFIYVSLINGEANADEDYNLYGTTPYHPNY